MSVLSGASLLYCWSCEWFCTYKSPTPRYIGARTDTTQQSGQTPDKDINHITVYASGYTETDTTGMLSPNNGRLSGANKVSLFRARYLLECA